ncbi:MAG: 16S rRNA (cytidine(1402)-2'-O)-methyltransferase [Burkholderiaceae bacterium]
MPVAPLEAALYVVATPIGNLSDISQRACDVLSHVSLIACEDTRVAQRLLRGLGLPVPALLATHAHNERSSTGRVLAAIAEGQACALISDAGTPAISDPGARLVHAAHEAGLRVVPIPGVSAVTTLLSVAGIDTDHHGDAARGYWFEGFLPSRASDRKSRLRELLALPGAIVLYESPHRIGATLADIGQMCVPPRDLIIGRELTKRFEQLVRLRTDKASDWLAGSADHGRGEFALVIAPAPIAPRMGHGESVDWQARPDMQGSVDDLILRLADLLPPRQAAKLAATLCGLPSRAIYERLLATRGSSANDVEG